MASSKRRTNTDIMKLIQSQYEVKIISDVELHVKFHGPVGSFYERGIFNVKVVLPDNYPYKSPSVGFLTRVFHPNIEEQSGSICLDVLNQTWTPLYNLNNIFDTLLPQLLMYPNVDDPLNAAAATLYLNQPEAYKKKVIEYVKRFAAPVTVKETPKKDDMSSDDESSLSDLSDFNDDDEGKGDGKPNEKYDEDEYEKKDANEQENIRDLLGEREAGGGARREAEEGAVGITGGEAGEKAEGVEGAAEGVPGEEAIEANENAEGEVADKENDESI